MNRANCSNLAQLYTKLHFPLFTNYVPFLAGCNSDSAIPSKIVELLADSESLGSSEKELDLSATFSVFFSG